MGATLAGLSLAVHRTPPPPEVLSLFDRMESALRHGTLPEHIGTGILSLIARLMPHEGAPGDGLCHGDIHPGNVIATADGPKLIEWPLA